LDSPSETKPGPSYGHLIDIPIESLPFVDEHTVMVDAGLEQVWDALIRTVGAFSTGRAAGPVTRALGCEQTECYGQPGEIGSTVPGFVVTRSVRDAVLALMGEHRFSTYALIFRLSPTPAGPVRLSAETRAEFSGPAGRAYRMAVIGTRGHVVATGSILRAVRRRAERA
jgi:hypothetical protein